MKGLPVLENSDNDGAVPSPACCRCHHSDGRIYVIKVTLAVLAVVLVVGHLIRRDEALMRETELIRSRLRAAGIWNLDSQRQAANDHLDTSVSDIWTSAAGIDGVDRDVRAPCATHNALNPRGISSQLNGQAAGGVRLPPIRPSRQRRQAGREDSSERPRSRDRHADDKVKKLQRKVRRNLKQKIDDWHANYKILRAHFQADVSNRSMNLAHELNGSITTLSGTITKDGIIPFDKKYCFWEEATEPDLDAFVFNQDEGQLTIRHNGTYLIYSQIVYHDESGRNSYGVYLRGQDDPLAQCLLYEVRGNRTSEREQHPGTHSYFQQCNTNTVRYLTAGSAVFIQGIYERRTIITKHALTFWGIVKLQ